MGIRKDDLFVAKLSGTNGSLIWVRTGGSATYTDYEDKSLDYYVRLVRAR